MADARTCAAGTYWNGTTCVTCEPGHFCPGFTDVPSPPPGHGTEECPAGTYADSPGATTCTPCTNGGAGANYGSNTGLTSSECPFTCNEGYTDIGNTCVKNIIITLDKLGGSGALATTAPSVINANPGTANATLTCNGTSCILPSGAALSRANSNSGGSASYGAWCTQPLGGGTCYTMAFEADPRTVEIAADTTLYFWWNCSAGYYAESDSICAEVESGYYSPGNNNDRYQCPDGMGTYINQAFGDDAGYKPTTTANAYSDCMNLIQISETGCNGAVREYSTTPFDATQATCNNFTCTFPIGMDYDTVIDADYNQFTVNPGYFVNMDKDTWNLPNMDTLCPPVGEDYRGTGQGVVVDGSNDTNFGYYRFPCPAGYKSAGFGTGADDLSDCKKVENLPDLNGMCASGTRTSVPPEYVNTDGSVISPNGWWAWIYNQIRNNSWDQKFTAAPDGYYVNDFRPYPDYDDVISYQNAVAVPGAWVADPLTGATPIGEVCVGCPSYIDKNGDTKYGTLDTGSGGLGGCYKTESDVDIPNGTGDEKCWWNPITSSYSRDCEITAKTCNAGYYHIIGPSCSEVDNGYYSNDDDMAQTQCPAGYSGSDDGADADSVLHSDISDCYKNCMTTVANSASVVPDVSKVPMKSPKNSSLPCSGPAPLPGSRPRQHRRAMTEASGSSDCQGCPETTVCPTR